MQKLMNSSSVDEMAASQNVSVHIKCPYPFQMHVSTSTECRKRGAEQCCLCQHCVQHVQIWQLHPQTDSSMQRGHSDFLPPQLLQWQTQHIQLERRGQRSRCTKMFQAPTCTGYISPFLFQASLHVCFHRVRLPNKPVCLCAQRWRERSDTNNAGEITKNTTVTSKMKQYGPPCISFNTVHVLAQPRTEWRVMLPL